MPLLRRKAEEAASALPALIMKADRAAQTIFHGEHAQRRAGAGEKFWQFREYTPQDRPQDIDWRQSGKTDRVFIRQKERQLPQTALFWTCTAESMDFSSSRECPAKSEAAQVLTLALAILMTHAGERVGMLGSAHTGRSAASLEHIGSLLLSKGEAESLPVHAPARGQKNTALILAGDFLDQPEKTETTFRALAPQAGGGLVIHVMDPAEIELPWQGRAVFKDSSAAHRELVENIDSVRAAYKKRIEDHGNALRKICTGIGWHYAFHRTDRPYEETLLQVWTALSALRERGAA
jgi:uncharacterized protein (DUF58 family)